MIEPVRTTPRARARAATIDEIKATARAQLAERGAAALSVRLVARELGMSSSGMYRYFASRDELLTALIIDAYDSIGEAVEQAEAAVERADLFGRWWAAASAVRAWARARPQEYGLVFGSPVPGYEAPQATVVPASRVPLVLGGILRDVWVARGEELDASDEAVGEHFGGVIAPQLGLPAEVIATGVLAFVQLFGFVSFELFGHLVGTVLDGDAFFRACCARIAVAMGVEPPATDVSGRR